jgi:branched-subunit amino acid transport protein
MSTILLILAMGGSVYALRLGGLALGDVAIPPAWERALAFVPVAVLSALVATSITTAAPDRHLRIVAAAGAAAVAVVSGRMWACIAGGMTLYWLLRLL